MADGNTGASAQTTATRQKDKPELRRLEKVCATFLPVSTDHSITLGLARRIEKTLKKIPAYRFASPTRPN
jgi:hypothetical protein